MLDQLSKNITRCGLSNSTLNYLRVRVPGAERAVRRGSGRGGRIMHNSGAASVWSPWALHEAWVTATRQRGSWLWQRLTSCPSAPPALCNPRTNAGAHVTAQDLQPQSPGLPQDLPVPEVAADGRAAR